MSSTPPMAWAQRPTKLPRRRPTATLIATIKNVAKPIAAATGQILTSRNARPTLTVMASMLVAKPATASSPKQWRVGFSSSVLSGALSAAQITRRPSLPSRVKVIQWSHDLTWSDAALPSAQPIRGVMASMTPKIAPVQSASNHRCICGAEPLPTAAAKASVDIASTSKTVEVKSRVGVDL